MPSLTINQRINYVQNDFGSNLCLEETDVASPQSIRDWLIIARSPTHRDRLCTECRHAVEILLRDVNLNWYNLDLRTWRSNLLVRRIRRQYYGTNPRFDSYEDPLGW